MKKLAIILSLIFVAGTSGLMAQSRHYSSATIGMGGGGTAYADGYHANFINPANLMLKIHRRKNTLGLVGGVGANTGGSLMNVSVYNKYLTKGLVIEGQVRENMLDEWFGSNSLNTRDQAANLNIIPFGFSHRGNKSAFSLATRLRVSDKVSLNKGFMELAAYGLDSQKFSEPVPVNFSVDAVSFAEISVGYARQILDIPNLIFAKDVKLFVGAAPKYLYGVYNTSFDFRSTLHMQSATATTPFSIIHNFEYDLRTIGEISRQMQAYDAAYRQDKNTELGDYLEFTGDDFSGPQATGFGLDLGATLEMDVSNLIPIFWNSKKLLRLSMSVTDLGKLTFDQDGANIFAGGEVDYFGATDDDEFESYFENFGDSLMNDVYTNFNTEDIDGITYNLPSMYNFGASLEMGKLLVALDYGIGFNSSGTNSKRSVLNLGARYKLFNFIPVSVGTRVGGFSSASYSAGIGLDLGFLEFSVGASAVDNSEKNGWAASAAWSGLVFRF